MAFLLSLQLKYRGDGIFENLSFVITSIIFILSYLLLKTKEYDIKCLFGRI